MDKNYENYSELFNEDKERSSITIYDDIESGAASPSEPATTRKRKSDQSTHLVLFWVTINVLATVAIVSLDATTSMD